MQTSVTLLLQRSPGQSCSEKMWEEQPKGAAKEWGSDSGEERHNAIFAMTVRSMRYSNCVNFGEY